MALLIAPAGCFQSGRLQVDKVIDGDTLYLTDGMKVRLYGIDAPERDQPFGSESRAALAEMADGPVRIEEMDRDRYGRVVAVVFIDGRNVNQEMVRTGAAWVYDRYCRVDFCFAWEALETAARSGKYGLWRRPGAVEPWKWRRR